jgi:hypothetical protein
LKIDKQRGIVIGAIIVVLILIGSATVWYFYLRPVTCKEFLDKLGKDKYKVGDVVKIRDKVDFVSIHKLPEMILPVNWSDPEANISLKQNGETITYTNVGFESTPEKGGDFIFTGDRRNDFHVGSEVEFSVVIKEYDYAGITVLGCEEFENAVLIAYYAVYLVWSGDYNVIMDTNISENGSVCKITVTDVKNPILGFDVENFQINDINLVFGDNSTGIKYCDIPLDTKLHTLNDYNYTIQFFDTDANGILSVNDYFIISNCELNEYYYLRLTKDGIHITEKKWVNV